MSIDRPRQEGWDRDSNEDENLTIRFEGTDPVEGATIHWTNNATHIQSPDSIVQHGGSGAYIVDNTYNPVTLSNVATVTQPIAFDFSNNSWKYTLLFVLSILLAPAFVILSKILRRPMGFKIRERTNG